MQTKRNKKGITETSQEEQKYFESYPTTTRLTLKQVLERSRKAEQAKELVK